MNKRKIWIFLFELGQDLFEQPWIIVNYSVDEMEKIISPRLKPYDNSTLRGGLRYLFENLFKDQSLYEKMCKWMKIFYSNLFKTDEDPSNIEKLIIMYGNWTWDHKPF